MVSDINLLIVSADSPFNNINDLIEAIKKKGPKSISFGGTGTGGADTYANFNLNKATQQQFNYVPFNSGGEVMTNLLGKHIDGAWANPNECIAQLEAKQVKILGVGTENRSPLFPNQPTIREQGYNVISNQTRSFVAKAGIPKEVIDYWVRVLDKVHKTPEWREYLKVNLLEDGWLVKDDFFRDAENDYKNTKVIMEEMGTAKK